MSGFASNSCLMPHASCLIPHALMPHNQPVRILGIDPGSVTTGFGVIDYERGRLILIEQGAINTPRACASWIRLFTLFPANGDSTATETGCVLEITSRSPSWMTASRSGRSAPRRVWIEPWSTSESRPRS